MKILEIIDTKYTSGPLRGADKEEIGYGAYSDVKKGGGDIEVTKVNDGRDGYKTYIDFISQHGLSSKNPYFPRVYEVRSGKGADEGMTEYEMEELYGLENFLSNRPEFIAYFSNRLFPKDIAVRIGDDLHSFIQMMDNHFYDAGHAMRHGAQAPDPQFGEAMKIVAKLSTQHNLGMDLHSENFMVRLTSVGPQLVITDPFSYTSA